MSRVRTFGFSVDILRALLWQYNDAPNLATLLQKKQTWYDANQTGFWEDWIRDVFDLRTANDFGLSVWSIILDMPLVAQLQPTPVTKMGWGFGVYRKNFNNGNFNRDGVEPIILSTEQRRLALRLRFFQLTTRGAIPEINEFLSRMFAELGAVYALDGLDMTLTYVFTFSPSSQIRFILDEFDVLPRPAGVSARYIVTTTPAWGLGAYRKNFDNGNFLGSA